MLDRSFSALALVLLGGSVVWFGCSGDVADDTQPQADAGGQTGTDAGGPTGTDDAGGSADDAGQKDSGSKEDGAVTGVDITYGTCPAFTKCGGDVAGTWHVSGGCVSSDAFEEAKKACPGFKESDVVIKASGTVVATATNIDRTTTVHVSAKLAVPKSCAPVPITDCALIASGLKTGVGPGAPKFDDATCTDGGTVCNCDVATTLTDSEKDTYKAVDGVLTTGNGRTFDYCVAGNKTTYRETSAQTGFSLPIIVEMTK